MTDFAIDGGSLDPGATLLILADIHGNWTALQAVLRSEPEVTDIICLGDWVNYGPDPDVCVRWGSRNLQPGRALRGNHDLAALTGRVPRHSRESVERLVAALADTRRALSRDDRDFLSRLPSAATYRVGGETWWAGHALPSDPLEGYLRGDAPESGWREEIRLAGEPSVLLVGHTHRPFLRVIGDTVIVNPGSVGRPKDGGSDASYAVWRGGSFSLRKVPSPMQGVDRRAGQDLSPAGPAASSRPTDGSREGSPPPTEDGPWTT